MQRLVVSDLALRVPGRVLFDGISFAADPGEMLAVMGPSGSGKTSLLNCLSGISVPSRGTVTIDGTATSRLGASGRASFRLAHIGLVFQFGELLPELPVVENVALPLCLLGTKRREAEYLALSILDRLGLGDRGDAHPDVLSGGEVQRVAIARALVHRPGLVLADEPTGALDERNAVELMALLGEQARELGATVVVATHDPLVAERVDRVLRLRHGTVAESTTAVQQRVEHAGAGR